MAEVREEAAAELEAALAAAKEEAAGQLVAAVAEATRRLQHTRGKRWKRLRVLLCSMTQEATVAEARSAQLAEGEEAEEEAVAVAEEAAAARWRPRWRRRWRRRWRGRRRL